jgi:hypothetical protein
MARQRDGGCELQAERAQEHVTESCKRVNLDKIKTRTRKEGSSSSSHPATHLTHELPKFLATRLPTRY